MIKIIKKINTKESKTLLINNLSKIENAFKGKKKLSFQTLKSSEFFHFAAVFEISIMSLGYRINIPIPLKRDLKVVLTHFSVFDV